MTLRPFSLGLEGMIWPHRSSDFIREFWQKRPLFVKGSPDRLVELRKLLFDFDLSTILTSADLGRSMVQPPLERQRTRPNGVDLPPPASDPNTFRLLYELGNQLYLHTSDVPEVSAFTERLATDLGRMWTASRGDIYATRKGGGADLHFDQNDNFTVQLSGSKTWWFGNQPYYDRPLHNSGHTSGVPYDPTYQFDANGEQMADLEKVVLEPGDFFYIPRGFLHGTRADEDALSFNINLGAAPWVDVVLDSLRTYLIRDPRWRASAMRDGRAADELLSDLRRRTQDISAADLLAGPASSETSDATSPVRQLRRNPLTWWSSHASSQVEEVLLEIKTPDRSSTTLQIAGDFLFIMHAIPADSRIFVADELLSRWPHEAAAAYPFIEELVEAGLLHWIDAAANPSSP